jgi:hypothetical protein
MQARTRDAPPTPIPSDEIYQSHVPPPPTITGRYLKPEDICEVEKKSSRLVQLSGSLVGSIIFSLTIVDATRLRDDHGAQVVTVKVQRPLNLCSSFIENENFDHKVLRALLLQP